MDDLNNNRYEILRELAVAGSGRKGLIQAAQTALRQAADLVGLQASAMYLWDDSMEVNLAASHAATDSTRERLISLEEDLFRSLRQDQQVLSAYITFGGETLLHSFTQPLRYGDKVFGAIIGIQEGNRTLVSEDDFLEALSAVLSLSALADGIGKDDSPAGEEVEKVRLTAVTETAVTVNHEINNPLTAILGNVQLLLLKRDDLDDELSAKLKTIEASAMKIRDVTQRLLRLTTARSVPYAEGTSMLDLPEGDNEKQE